MAYGNMNCGNGGSCESGGGGSGGYNFQIFAGPQYEVNEHGYDSVPASGHFGYDMKYVSSGRF